MTESRPPTPWDIVDNIAMSQEFDALQAKAIRHAREIVDIAVAESPPGLSVRVAGCTSCAGRNRSRSEYPTVVRELLSRSTTLGPTGTARVRGLPTRVQRRRVGGDAKRVEPSVQWSLICPGNANVRTCSLTSSHCSDRITAAPLR